MLCKSFLVSGKVQGVGFRQYVYYVAQKLSLTGWVRNLNNGEVEVLASGSEKNLAALAIYLKKGPPLSRVKEVKEKALEGIDLNLIFEVIETGEAKWW